VNEGRRRVLDPVERVSEVLFGHADDVRGAIEVFLLVFCSTLPVVVPFVLFDAVPRAMRVSNAVAVVMLGVGGYSLGRYGGLRPWRTAAAMTGLGLILVALTMALGG
jgi:VIT1/CCC1 family predicted Fe2+/Mn2+ transporter